MPMNEKEVYEFRADLKKHGEEIAGFKEWKEGVEKGMDNFVTKAEFTLIKFIVYSVGGTFISTVISFLFTKVMKP